MKTTFIPQSRKSGVVVQDLNGELLIYDLEAGKAFCLNASSSLIWQLCDGTKSIDTIGAELSQKLDTLIGDDFVWLAVDKLKEQNLLENGEQMTTPFTGINRRDVIKKIGLTTMVALPVISAIVAPNAVSAASVCITAGNTTCNCNFQDGNNNNGPGGPRATGFCTTIPLTVVGTDTCNVNCRCQITDVSNGNCPVLSGNGSATIHVCAGTCVQ